MQYDRNCGCRLSYHPKKDKCCGSSRVKGTRCSAGGRHERTDQRPAHDKYGFGYSKRKSERPKYKHVTKSYPEPYQGGPAHGDSKFTSVYQHSEGACQLFKNTDNGSR